MHFLADHVKVSLDLLLFIEMLDGVATFGRGDVGCVFELKGLEDDVVGSEGKELEHLVLVFEQALAQVVLWVGLELVAVEGGHGE